MTLPGADPIAAALAAGETPSPEMIAASQEKEGFSRRTAVLCFSGVVLSLVIGRDFRKNQPLARRCRPPDALADRPNNFEDNRLSRRASIRDYGFTCCDQQAIQNLYRYPQHAAPDLASIGRHPIFSVPPTPGESPSMNAFQLGILGSLEQGMIFEHLDGNGRLLRLEVRPWPRPRNSRWIGRFILRRRADIARFTPATRRTSRRCRPTGAWLGLGPMQIIG
jgi:hypothetical protein